MADPTQIATRDTSGASQQTTGSTHNDGPKPASSDNVDRFNKNMAPETPPAESASGVAATQTAQIQGEDSPKPTTRTNDSEKVMNDRRDRGERTESMRDERGERPESMRGERGGRPESMRDERPERMRDERSNAVPAGNAKGSSASAASNDMPAGDAKGSSDGAKPATSGGDSIPHPNDLLTEFASEQKAAGNSELDLPPDGFSKDTDSASFVYSNGGSAKASGSNSKSSAALEADSDNNVVSGLATTKQGEEAFTGGKIAGGGEGELLGAADAGEGVDTGLELVDAGSSDGNQGPTKITGFAFADKGDTTQTDVVINDPDDQRGDSLAKAIARGGDSVGSFSSASESSSADTETFVDEEFSGDGGLATADAVAGPDKIAFSVSNRPGLTGE